MPNTALRRFVLAATSSLVALGLSSALLVPIAAADSTSTGVAGTDSAGATGTPPTTTTPWVPTEGIYFNNPMGTEAEQFVISNESDRAVDNTPAGATIYFTSYSMTAKVNVDAMVRAYRRGVFLKVLVDSHVVSDQMIRLRNLLGTDRTKSSYFRTCRYSCMASRPSYMHSKVMAISTTGGKNFVTMISSANPATTGSKGSWNNMYLVVGDQKIYAANVKYFHDMLPDRNQPNYLTAISSGKLRQWFTPRSSGDTMMSVLKRVTCLGTAPGYGTTTGRTRIRVAMYEWTNLRVEIARRLSQLQGQGCEVQVIYSADQVEAKVTRALLKKTARGAIPVYNGRIDRDGDRVLETYVHHKYLTINGVYGTDTSAKLAFTGSTNFTLNTIRSNNETVLRINDPGTLAKFEANFKFMRENWSKRVRSAASSKALRKELADAWIVNEDGDVVQLRTGRTRQDLAQR